MSGQRKFSHKKLNDFIFVQTDKHSHTLNFVYWEALAVMCA